MKQQEISVEVWNDNYRAPGENSPEDTWKREAKACSEIEDESVREKVYNDFLWLLSDYRGMAGGRITANIGVEDRQATTLFNCFVHAPGDINYKDPDSIEGIYDMLKAQAHTLKSEGGYGMSFSWIRPNGSYVKGIGSRTPGVLKFMELWDKSSEIITMGSEEVLSEKKASEKKKIRKGAQMGSIAVWHPEVEAFIDAKLTSNRLTKFNLSVGITEGFMEAVEKDEIWKLKFPDTSCKEYKTEWFGDIYDWENKGYPVVIHKEIKAKYLWDKIMKSTYTRNDPGVLFLDIANKLNPLMYAEKLHVSNPCGEVIMSTGVCNLCSLNLVKFIEKKNNSYSFNFDLFKKAVSIAVRFADNINDISRTPIVDYKKSMIEKRRIGLGVLGLGSLMYILGIRFGSKKSLKLIEDIFKAKCETELLTSAKLGVEKGSFKLFDKEKYFNSFWWKTLPISEEIKSNIEAIGEMRNSHLSANAPTGNMSIYAGVVSGGIEPVFMKEYARWSIITEGDRIELRNNGFKFPDVFKGEWFETDELKFSQAGTDQVLLGNFNGIEYQVDKNRGLTKKTVVQDYGWQFVKHNFSQEQIDKMQEDGVFATTEELSVEDHINSLKVIAKYVSMNSSKTVNIPNDYPYDKFQNLYFDAWKSGIKGLTSYRAGTMTAVLEKDDKKKRNLIRPTKIMTSMAPKRPQELSCEIHQASVKGQKWTVLVGLFDGAPYEIFMGHSETLHLPSKCSLGKIVKQNKGKYNLHVDFDGEDMIIKDVIKTFDNAESAWATRMISMSLRHGVPIDFIVDQLARDGIITDVNKVTSRILKKYIKDGLKVRTNIVCESCGSDDLIYQEGCALCKSCNNSKCG